MADTGQSPTLGEVAYLAWWREFEHGHGYDRQTFLSLPQRHRNAWQAAAEAAVAERSDDPEAPSGEDRIRDVMAEAQNHPGRVITR